MKMRIFALISIAAILAMFLCMVAVSPASAGPPVIFTEEYNWPGISTKFVCPGFQVYEDYHEDLVGMTLYDKNGIPLKSHVQIETRNILTRMDKPEVKVYIEGHYSGFWLYDETGNWVAVQGSGLPAKLSIKMPGKGILLVDSGHAYCELDPFYCDGSPNFYTSQAEVDAVCEYMAAQ